MIVLEFHMSLSATFDAKTTVLPLSQSVVHVKRCVLMNWWSLGALIL